MTYPYPGDDPAALIADLDASEWEAEQLREVPAEVDGQDPPPDPYGPWDDLNAATAQMDRAHELDAQRLIEDVTDGLERRPSAESKLARAIQRAEAGTLTPPQQFRPAARDAHGQFAPGACGDSDDLGYCTSRYHDPGCSSVIAASAATGNVAAAEAWRDTMAAHPPPPGVLGYAAELAGEPLDGTDAWAELLQAPGAGDPGLIHARMLAEMGEAETPPAEPPEPLPPVTDLRAALGI